MEIVTLPTLCVAPLLADNAKPGAKGAKSAKSANEGEVREARCPFAGLAAAPGQSCPFATSAEGTSSVVVERKKEGGSWCPFAGLDQGPKESDVVGVVGEGEGTVEVVRRRCPLWVRVIRWGAKYIAKQVVIRSVKGGVMGVLKAVNKKDE